MSVSRGKGSKGGIGPLRNLISLALFGVAAILFIVVGVMYFRDKENGGDIPPTPVSKPGHAQLKNVYDAVAAQGIKVDYIRGAGPRFDLLTRPTQGLTADGRPLYIFIYDDPSQREAETTGLLPEDLVPISLGSATNPPELNGTPHAVGNSNVYAVLFGADDALSAKVDKAIQGIP